MAMKCHSSLKQKRVEKKQGIYLNFPSHAFLYHCFFYLRNLFFFPFIPNMRLMTKKKREK